MKKKLRFFGIAAMFMLFLPIAAQALPTGDPSLELLTLGDEGFVNGAFFTSVDPQPTGTGVIEPFVRIQNNGEQEGYNTSGTLRFDEKSGIWTHDLTLGDVPVVTIDDTGTLYREFLLDVNQISSSPNISLDVLSIYLNSTAFTTNTPTDVNLLGTRVYDLGDNWIRINYDINPGSGGGDMLAYIPNDLFAGYSSSTYLYLYSYFGHNDFANDGFEEWAVRTPTTPPVPEPATMLLLGSGLLGLAGFRRRIKK